MLIYMQARHPQVDLRIEFMSAFPPAELSPIYAL